MSPLCRYSRTDRRLLDGARSPLVSLAALSLFALNVSFADFLLLVLAASHRPPRHQSTPHGPSDSEWIHHAPTGNRGYGLRSSIRLSGEPNPTPLSGSSARGRLDSSNSIYKARIISGQRCALVCVGANWRRSRVVSIGITRSQDLKKASDASTTTTTNFASTSTDKK